MIIRQANKEDAPIISLLARVTFDETFGHLFRDREDLLTYFETTFSVEKIESSIEKEHNVFWLSFVKDLPVGYSKLKLNSPSQFLKEQSVAQLQKIYVLKDFLSQNIGRQLQDEMIIKARKSEAKELWLSVLDSNERAIQFYQKSGYRNIGEHDFSIGKENFRFIALSLDLGI